MLNVPHFRQRQGTMLCLVVSVRMVLKYFGIDRTEEEIQTVMKTKASGTTITNITELPKAWGVETPHAWDFQSKN